MGQIYDISMKITNELPSLKITDDIIVTINNRHTNILNIQAMAQENERRPEGEQMEEFELISKSMALLVGESKAKEIDDMDLPLPEYKELYRAMFEIATTGSLESTPN